MKNQLHLHFLISWFTALLSFAVAGLLGGFCGSSWPGEAGKGEGGGVGGWRKGIWDKMYRKALIIGLVYKQQTI